MDGQLLLEGHRECFTRILVHNKYYNAIFGNLDITSLINNEDLISNDFQRLLVKSDTLTIPIQTGYKALVEIKALPVGIIANIPKEHDVSFKNDNLIRLDEVITRNGLVLAEILSEQSQRETLYAFTAINSYKLYYEYAETERVIAIKHKATIPALRYVVFDQTDFIALAQSHGGYDFLNNADFVNFLQHKEYMLVIYLPLFMIDIHYIK